MVQYFFSNRDYEEFCLVCFVVLCVCMSGRWSENLERQKQRKTGRKQLELMIVI